MERFENPLVIVLLNDELIVLATLSTNIAANVVSPANDFANLASRIKLILSYGGLITAVIGI